MDASPPFEIYPTENGVSIHWPEQGITWEHSFLQGKLVRRSGQPQQAILKACSNRKKTIHSVLDMTGGWGQDSFILASHGKQVTLLEKDRTVFDILQQSWQRLGAQRPDDLVKTRLAMINTSAADYLSTTEAGEFDCIYLDPMFPAHKSGAKPSKSLQLLQQITDNEAIENSFTLALLKAGNRVVVKRPLKAPTLTDLKPDQVLKEKTIRFDIYLRIAGSQ